MSVTPRLMIQQLGGYPVLGRPTLGGGKQQGERKGQLRCCQVTATLNQILSVIYSKVQTSKAVSHLGAVRWSGPLLPCTPSPAIPLHSSVSPSSKAFSLCHFIKCALKSMSSSVT